MPAPLKMMSSSSSFASSIQEALASKFSAFVSWIAAGVGLATVAGWVSLVAGALSALWLGVQLWNYFTFTYPKNVRERQEDERREYARRLSAEEHEDAESDFCSTVK